MGTNETMTKKQKAGKIISYVINIISVIIMLFSVFIVISYLSSQDRGYPVYFGRAYAVVQSDSMAKDLSRKDNFKEGDIICFRVLSDSEKQELSAGTAGVQDGDVVTFWDNNIAATKVLNTHRIYEVRVGADGKKEYSTMGDNNLTYDKDQQGNQIWRKADDIQGVFAGKASGIGNILMFIQSKTGFAVLIVVPCVLIMIYCATLVILNLVKYTKQKAILQHEDNVEELREQMKAELLKELEEKKKKEEKAEEKPTDEPKDDKPEGESAEEPKEEKPAEEDNKDEENK